MNRAEVAVWARSLYKVLAATGAGHANGAIAGGQIGTNWQFGTAVVGLEGDFQWSRQSKISTTGCGVGCTLTETGGIRSFGTARARIAAGFDRVLVYATGGAAWTNASDQLRAS